MFVNFKKLMGGGGKQSVLMKDKLRTEKGR
jgi:hypothetical protein